METVEQLTTDRPRDYEWVDDGFSAVSTPIPPTPPAVPSAIAPIEPQPNVVTSTTATSSDHTAKTLQQPAGTRKQGAPYGNTNRVSSGLRRSGGLPGSKLPKGCGRVEMTVCDLVERTRTAWEAKHGAGPIPLAAESLIKQIRRAEERDRLAAKQLKDGADLKGEPLTFERQERLQAAQEAAGKLIEACLRKLGLGVDPADGKPDPWAALNIPPQLPANGNGGQT